MRTALVVALVFLSATSLAGRFPVSRTIVVRGIVTDSVTGRRLEGARIVAGAGNPIGNADTAGEYLLKIPAADGDSVVELRVTRVGYVRQSCTARLSGDTIKADFVMRRAPVHVQEIILTKHGPVIADGFNSGPSDSPPPKDSLHNCS